jgi:hypothetical protein
VAFGVGVRVQIEDPLDDQTVGCQDSFIHPAAIFIEVFYYAHILSGLT